MKNKKPKFVIHLHKARKLHYDFRLEMDKVLRSWAIPKKPPLKIGVKKLAVQVEDHPISYANFEGKIPKGSYGAGIVKIWDSGSYELKKRSSKKINFLLHGKKMKGVYCLIKFKKERNKNLWLIFKVKK
jgi:DNA ligase D-like protein (predicted 3'-phosphoesterase)